MKIRPILSQETVFKKVVFAILCNVSVAFSMFALSLDLVYDLRIWWFNSHSWVTVPKQDLSNV